GLDVVEHLLDHLAQRLALALLREDVQALDERQARVDHGRELAREDHDLPRRDPRADAELEAGRLLFDLDRDEPLPAQVVDDLVPAGQVDRAGLELAGQAAGGVRESRHGILRPQFAGAPLPSIRSSSAGSAERLMHSSSVTSPATINW